jgi:hypothetical protein
MHSSDQRPFVEPTLTEEAALVDVTLVLQSTL